MARLLGCDAHGVTYARLRPAEQQGAKDARATGTEATRAAGTSTGTAATAGATGASSRAAAARAAGVIHMHRAAYLVSSLTARYYEIL
jgi:hypothetical protein